MFGGRNQFLFGRLVATDRIHTQRFRMDKDDFFFFLCLGERKIIYVSK